MNQVYKVIWSRVKNCYVVVSELTKRVGRGSEDTGIKSYSFRAFLCALIIAGCMLPADADAAQGLTHAGTSATASGDSSIAYGYNAKAMKKHSIAQGTGADAEEEYALAMGYKAIAKGVQSLAIGKQANAIGNNSVAAGAGAKGYAKDGVAIGNNAESGTADNKDPRIPTIDSNNGVAVGNSAKASGGSSVSVGNDSIGSGPSSVAIGNAATANDVRTTAVGNNAHAEGAGSLSIGREASALTLENAGSTNPLVTGTDEQLDKKGVMAIGDDAMASGNNSIALGTSAKAGDLERTRNTDSVSLTGSAKRITKLTAKRSVNNAVAIGTESSVQSDEDIAVGYRAATVKSKYHQLPGSGQVAIGSNSNTYGTRGDVAIGSGAETNIRVKNVDHTTGAVEKPDGQSVAIGSVAKAYGSQAVAVGADTRAIGNSSVAIGTDDIQLDRTKLETLLPGLANNENLNNKAPNDVTLGSAALGDKPYYVKTASIGTASVALGAMSQAAGDASMAMGLNALAEGDASTAIGPLARSKGKNAVAMGVSAQAAGGKNNTAIGHEAKVESAAGDDNVAFGSSASVTSGAGHVVIGKNASANTVNGSGIAIGNSASIGIGAAADAAAIGTGSRVEGSGIAFGQKAQVTASSTESGIAIGTESSVDGAQKGTAIGYKAKVLRSGDDSGLAIGTESSAGGSEGSIALGKKASVDSSTNAGGVAIGLNASAKGVSAIVIGKDAKADNGNQANTIAIGVGATATGTSQYSSVMGSGAKASREYSTVLGSNANSEVDGGVALGANSISNRHAGGSATGDTKTTNPYIPAGASTAQVNAINATKGTTGAVSVGSDTVKRQIINVAAGTDDSDAVNVAQLKAAAANAAGNVSWTAQGNGNDVNAVKNGSKVNFADGTNTTASVAKDASGKVTTVKYNLKKDVDLGPDGSLTINGNTYINKDGINAGNKQITNVASGGNVTTNAANIGDIDRIVTAKDKYVTGGTATYQANGDGTANLTGTNGLTANVTGLKNNYVTSGSVSNDGKTLTLERNDTGKVNVDLSKIFTEVAKEDYHLVENPEAGSQGKYKADSDGNMVLTVANENGDKKQVTLTDIASKAQQDINTTNITNINTTIDKGLNFGGDSGAAINKKLGEKLEIKGGATADLTENNIGVVSDGTKLNVKLKKDVNLGTDGSLTINGKTYVNKDGLNANSQKITNVAAGTDGTDAVNVDQLNAAIGGTAKATTVKAKDANVTVTEGISAETGGKEYTLGLGDTVTLGTAADKKVVVDGTSGKITAGNKVTIDGTTGDIQAGTVKVTGAGTVNELTNRTWDIDNPTVVHGQAATEDQLKTVSDGVKTNTTNITNINNTIGKGLNFKGDDTTVINKKLGEQLDIKGGADASKLSENNIGVVSGNGALNVKLAKELKDLTSVTTGDTVMNNDGLTITGGPKIVKTGIDAGGQKITNVAAGTVNSDAVNFGQLKDAVAAGKTILKDGKNTTVEGEGTVANPYKVNVNDDLVLGKKGADGKDGSIGINGKDGSSVVIHGKDGISIKGKDGKDGVTIKAKDGANGTEGQIGLTGPAGKDGKSTHADIGVNAGPASLDPAKNLSATEMTRIYYVDEKGDHQVATMDDGMKFAGNTGLAVKKLNSTMTIKGTGTKADTEYDPSNIKTMVDSNGEMIVGLDKNLKVETITAGKDGKDGKVGVAGANGKDGVTITAEGPAGQNGVDGHIGINGKDGTSADIHVKDGAPGVDGAPGTHLTRIVYEDKNHVTHEVATLDDGMKYGGDTGAVIKKKLNGQVNVVGGITDTSKLTDDDNIGVVSDGSDNLKIRLAKDVNLGPNGSLTINGKTYINKDGLNANSQKITNVANGTVNSDAVNFGQLKDAVAAGKTILKDGKNTTVEGEGTVANPYKVNVKDDLVLGEKGANGKDGSIGVNGKDGSAVVINGKDGSIGMNGKDGANGLTIKGGDGKPGVDGTNITRLIIEEKDGKQHDVATLDDGLKFAGNTGIVAKKLNSTMTIKGTGTKADTEYDPSNIKTMVNSNGEMIVGLDKNLKADSIAINGKDGKDGATIKGGDGKPGVDGTNITRLIIEEKDGKQHDIATLDDGMKYGGDTGDVIKKKLNEQVNVIGGIKDESKLTTDDNIGVVSDGNNNLKVRLAKDIKLNSVTAGNVVMDTTGFYVKNTTRTPAGTGTVSLTADGLNNGGNKIANVAAGEADTDAVNVSQLKNQGSEIINKGFGIKAEDGNEVKKKLGESVDVVGDGKNISTRVEGGKVKVTLKDDIFVKSVTTGHTKMDTNGLTIQDGSGNTAVTVDKDGLKIKDGPSVTKAGIDAGGKKITNVAAGEADTDAVNVSQLKKAAASATTKVADGKNTTVTSETNADGSKTYRVNLNDDITLGSDPSKQVSIKGTEGTIKAGQVTVNGAAGTVNGLTNKTWDPNNITSGQAATEDQLKVVSGQAGKHSSVTAGSNISVTTGTNANGGTEYKVAVVDTPTFKTVTTGNTVMSNSGLTIKDGPSVTQTGIDAGGKQITNVAAGKADTDAVNVGQLKQIGGAVNNIDNRINRVGAGAAALAALHPLDFDPDDKWDFTLGYGNYKDAHALALGAFYRPNEDTMISVGGSMGGGENMINAGLSVKLGQGNHVSTSRVAMAKEIKDLRAELENMKGTLIKVAEGKQLDSLDMDKMQLFPDVPENHWAYDYVATLAGNGVIVGYPDGQFGGDRMMTRYEMAALIYRAMQNGAAADDRMARALKEFEPELERIRVDTITKHKDGTPDIQRVRVIKDRG